MVGRRYTLPDLAFMSHILYTATRSAGGGWRLSVIFCGDIPRGAIVRVPPWEEGQDMFNFCSIEANLKMNYLTMVATSDSIKESEDLGMYDR